MLKLIFYFFFHSHWYWTASTFCAAAGYYKIALGEPGPPGGPSGPPGPPWVPKSQLFGMFIFYDYLVPWLDWVCFVSSKRRRKKIYFTLCYVIISQRSALWIHFCLMNAFSLSTCKANIPRSLQLLFNFWTHVCHHYLSKHLNLRWLWMVLKFDPNAGVTMEVSTSSIWILIQYLFL